MIHDDPGEDVQLAALELLAAEEEISRLALAMANAKARYALAGTNLKAATFALRALRGGGKKRRR